MKQRSIHQSFLPCLFAAYMSHKMYPLMLSTFFWNEFLNERLREIHTAEAHTEKESILWCSVSLSADGQH